MSPDEGSEAERDFARAEPSDHRTVIRLWLKLLACTTLVESELRRQLRLEFKFTLPRFEILAQLDRCPEGMMLRELSKRLMVSAGNVTPIVERLIADGYVTRTSSELDRRVQIVSLTLDGRRKFRRMAKRNGRILADIFAKLPPEGIEALSALLSETKEAILAAKLEIRGDGEAN